MLRANYTLEKTMATHSSVLFFFFFFICGGFCHTLKWNSQGFTCVPHPNPPSHLPLHPFPLGFNPRDGRAWWAAVYGATQSLTRLKRLSSSNYTVGASFVAQVVKTLPAMQETQVRFLGWEESLEKEMTTHSGILAWRIPWTEEPGRLQSWGHKSQMRLYHHQLYTRHWNRYALDELSILF